MISKGCNWLSALGRDLLRSGFVLCLLLMLFLAIPAALSASPDREPPFQLPQHSELLKLRRAIVFTSRGTIFLELFPADAPWHVANFKYLADTGFYRGLQFHLHEDGYYVQGGAPTTDPNSGPGWTIPAEFNQRKHVPGTVGMSRNRVNELNVSRRSSGSQFYIMTGEFPKMDGQYTIFARIIAGLDVAEQLRRGDTIDDIKVYVR